MELIVDPDVQAVAELMQCGIASDRVVAVANGLAKIAPILWGNYQSGKIETLKLVERPIYCGLETE